MMSKAPTSSLNCDLEERVRTTRGRLVAQFLAGAWRCSSPPLAASVEELAEIAPLLLTSGAGALAWRRCRQLDLRTSPAMREFYQAYRLHSLQAALHERSLRQVISLLRGGGVEPVLVKGWAIARLYPEIGLRPYGDLDLCVAPEQYKTAQALLNSCQGQGHNVDLHQGFGKFYEWQTEDLFAHSQLIKLDDVEVRVLSAEDHLRFLCIHLLRHGAVRPLWLSDIAVALETRPANFDWDRCLSGSRRLADWVACAIGLTHQLLGVEVESTPVSRRAQNLPSWLVPVVLKEWSEPLYFRAQMVVYLKHLRVMWRELLKELPRHWPNPIEATAGIKGPFNELPRLPFQVGHVISRATWLLAQLPELFRVAFHRRS